jgi:DNA-directed RNA polymerase specialized sigma subunit
MNKLAAIANTLVSRAQRKQRELELWRQWKQTQSSQVLEELFKSLTPLLKKIALNYQGNLPPAFIEGEVKRQAFTALQTYQEGYGAALATHITNQCQQVLREIYKYQNPTRLAEETHIKVPSFQNVVQNLHENLGRPPTLLEMAREFKVPVGEARRLQAGMRRDLGAIEGGAQWKPSMERREEEILDLLYYQLNPQEQQVLEYLYGRNGKPQLVAKDIALRMGLTQARVSQIKSRIAQELEKHFGGQKQQVSQFW